MKPRLQGRTVAPGGYQALLGLEQYLQNCGLEESLRNLVVLRASQINHCAFCIDMHSKDLRAMGDTEQRLYLLDAWREAPFYSPRERAALEWAEAVTRLAPDFVPDELYERARKEFTEKELVDLTMLIVAINGWNRLNVAFRTVAGNYRPSAKSPARTTGSASAS